MTTFGRENEYSKDDLYDLLEVPVASRKGSWDTGYRQYQGEFFVFANIGTSGRSGEDHGNFNVGNRLYWQSKKSHSRTTPSITKMLGGEGPVHIFYRTDNKARFRYWGPAEKVAAGQDAPVKVIWKRANAGSSTGFDPRDPVTTGEVIDQLVSRFGMDQPRFIRLHPRGQLDAQLEGFRRYVRSVRRFLPDQNNVLAAARLVRCLDHLWLGRDWEGAIAATLNDLPSLAAVSQATTVSPKDLSDPGAVTTNGEGQQSSGSRQGFGLNSAEKKAIELRAMSVVGDAWRVRGWAVNDVSDQCSYDLLCKKDGVSVRVEVKGTTGAGKTVMITRNEVADARAHHPNTALCIVSGIALEKGNQPEATGGTLEEYFPWHPDEGSLVPTEFEYTPPPRT